MCNAYNSYTYVGHKDVFNDLIIIYFKYSPTNIQINVIIQFYNSCLTNYFRLIINILYFIFTNDFTFLYSI